MIYFVLREAFDDTTAYVTDVPAGLTDKFELVKGVPRLAGWPEDLAAEFSKDQPEGMVLTDAVPNTFDWLLVSGRFKKMIEESGPPDVEYLPLKIKNHKGRIAADDCWIINFVTLVEAVDRELSAFRVDAAEDDQISKFTRLVLRDPIVEKGPSIFRLKEARRMVLVREDLASTILAAGLTGLKLVEASQFTTFRRR
jgi:uncharacterized protein DUF1629